MGPEHSGIPEAASGSKLPFRSPPPSTPAGGAVWPGDKWFRDMGEAAQTIREECERLFCNTLSEVFLGERNRGRQELLVMDAYRLNLRQDYTNHPYNKVKKWIEVWDYAGDATYRGFVTTCGDEETLFVFFEDYTSGNCLKSGLLALFELASLPVFGCARIVTCIPRSGDTVELDIVRNLGWCGFELTTLDPWILLEHNHHVLSPKWLFLVAEI